MRSDTIKTLEKAEKAGVRIPIDSTEWFETARNLARAERDFPLNLEISPGRCELVAEARRIADVVATRPAVAPEGVVYRHTAKELTAALERAVRHIRKFNKENGDDQPSESVESDDQSNSQESADGSPAEDRPAADSAGIPKGGSLA